MQFQMTRLHHAMVLALPALAALCGAAHAQDKPTASTVPEVVVNARKQTLPGGSALPAQQLSAGKAATGDTAALLADVPGASVNAAGGMSSLPALHGLADDRLRIKVDGMDLIASCPNHMNPALSYISPAQLGSLKVFAGITPVSAGGDSLGGSIVAESRAPEFAAPGQPALNQGEIGASLRSNNKARNLNVSATHATQDFSLRYDGSIAKADNYTAGATFKSYDFTGRAGHTLARDEVGSTAYSTRNHALSVAFKRDDHLFEARLGAQDVPYQLYPNQRMDMLKNDQRSVNLSYTGQMNWGVLQARAYHETVDHYMDFGADKRYWYGAASGGATSVNSSPCSPISATCAAGMPMYTDGKTTGLSVKGDINLSDRDVLRVGADLQQYTINDWWPPSGGGMWPGTFWNIREGKRNRAGLFGEWEGWLSPAWTTLVGARVERVHMDAGKAEGYSPGTNGMGTMMHYQMRDAAAFNAADRSTNDNNVDLTALARFTASPTQTIEFGFAHKERSPNVYERFPWSTWQMAALMNNFVGDGNGYVGNIRLKPEKANTLSATFDWHAQDERWGFKATPYYTQVTDYIDAVQWNPMSNQRAVTPAARKFSVLKYMNQSARIYGLDLSGQMPLAQNDWGQWGLRGLFSTTRGTNRDTGDGLVNIMPSNARLSLTQQKDGWSNSAELVMVGAKKHVSSMRNEVTTPGYALVNLRASHSWGKVRLDVGVENLFDRFYSLPTGGAYVGQGTTMSNPALPNYPQWGTAVPGMGRTVYVAMNVMF
ncbi:MAG: TonB-dependent receptor plug domain-containing protein [Hydrogenophaga sp.]|nr:TonB-dependent receptor plug domain-containing protein [Hydrogenophaga sp.]